MNFKISNMDQHVGSSAAVAAQLRWVLSKKKEKLHKFLDTGQMAIRKHPLLTVKFIVNWM
jgi:hypothetical protein